MKKPLNNANGLINAVLSTDNPYLAGLRQFTTVQLDYAAFEAERLVYNMYDSIYQNSNHIVKRKLTKSQNKYLQKRMKQIRTTSLVDSSTVTPQQRAKMYKKFYIQSHQGIYNPNIKKIKTQMRSVLNSYHYNMSLLVEASNQKATYFNIDTKIREIFELSEYGDFLPKNKKRKAHFDKLIGDSLKDKWDTNKQVLGKEFKNLYDLGNRAIDEIIYNDNKFVKGIWPVLEKKTFDKGTTVAKALWNRFHPQGRPAENSITLDTHWNQPGVSAYQNSGKGYHRVITTNVNNIFQQTVRRDTKYLPVKKYVFFRWKLHPAHNFMLTRPDNPQGIDACDVYAGAFHPRYDHNIDHPGTSRCVPPRVDNECAWEEPKPAIETMDADKREVVDAYIKDNGLNEKEFFAGLYEVAHYPNEPHPNGRCYPDVVVIEKMEETGPEPTEEKKEGAETTATDAQEEELVAEEGIESDFRAEVFLELANKVKTKYMSDYYARRIAKRSLPSESKVLSKKLKLIEKIRDDKKKIVALKAELAKAEINYFKRFLNRELSQEMGMRFIFQGRFKGKFAKQFVRTDSKGAIRVARDTIAKQNSRIRGATAKVSGGTKKAIHFSNKYVDVELEVLEEMSDKVIKHKHKWRSKGVRVKEAKELATSKVRYSPRAGSKEKPFRFMERKAARELSAAKLAKDPERFRRTAVKWFIYNKNIVQKVSPETFEKLIEMGYEKYLR